MKEAIKDIILGLAILTGAGLLAVFSFQIYADPIGQQILDKIMGVIIFLVMLVFMLFICYALGYSIRHRKELDQ